jgi:hypothetical protein
MGANTLATAAGAIAGHPIGSGVAYPFSASDLRRKPLDFRKMRHFWARDRVERRFLGSPWSTSTAALMRRGPPVDLSEVNRGDEPPPGGRVK